MALWFETKIRYLKMNDSGLEKKVTEAYLVDALTFTEAETKIINEMGQRISGDFTVTAVKKTKISEIFNKDHDRFWNVKASFITLDAITGIEKQTTNEMLVGAKDFDTAVAEMYEGMKGTLADWEITSLSESPILEIIE